MSDPTARDDAPDDGVTIPDYPDDPVPEPDPDDEQDEQEQDS